MEVVDDNFFEKVCDAQDTDLFGIAALLLCNINASSKRFFSLQVLNARLLARNPLFSHF